MSCLWHAAGIGVTAALSRMQEDHCVKTQINKPISMKLGYGVPNTTVTDVRFRLISCQPASLNIWSVRCQDSLSDFCLCSKFAINVA
jgi:hypothetical protein